MPALRLCLLLLTGAVAACSGHPDSRACQWPAESYRPLDLSRSADRTHLRSDAESAETIAIHYADVSPERRQGPNQYAGARDQCMATLLGLIARNHATSVERINAYAAERNRIFDAAVLFSFALTYLLVAFVLAGRSVRQAATDNRLIFAIAVAGLSVVSAILATMALDLWATTAESLRLGSWHLSYRADRLPWQHHRMVVFLVAVLFFWPMALLRYRQHHRGAPSA